MSIAGEQSVAWADKARDHLIRGVSSQFRDWGEDTIVVERGEGAHVIDVDGRRYHDLRNGYGPVVLGHGDPRVADAVAAAAHQGNVFALTQRLEIEAAQRFRGLVPWADRIRWTNTGTEATMHALRIARGFTGRDVIVKCEGAYHGMHDYVLWSTSGATPRHLGSPRAPIPLQGSSGVPSIVRELVRTVPFNDLDALERLLRTEGRSVAAVIVEPVLGNCFGIMPADNYLAGVRQLCDEHEALLVFDEVKTGFRVARGGAAEKFGVRPDIGTFAKALGNGFPVAAIAVRQEIANAMAPGEIAQAGTYSGNRIAVAAANATLTALADDATWQHLQRIGTELMEGVRGILDASGVAGHVLGVPAMFGIHLSQREPHHHRDTAAHDTALYERLARGMIARGAFPDLDAREPWFPSAATSDEDVAKTLGAFEEALDEAVN